MEYAHQSHWERTYKGVDSLLLVSKSLGLLICPVIVSELLIKIK